MKEWFNKPTVWATDKEIWYKTCT